MRTPLDEQAMADSLPGTWTIAATNFSVWLTGKRRNPKFTYGVVSRNPLVFSDEVAYVDGPARQEGAKRRILGKSTLAGDEFIRRGSGKLALSTTRWYVGGISDDHSIAALHFPPSRRNSGGLNIMLREGASEPELRAVIAHSADAFGVSLEQFATLSWLGSAAER